MNKKETYEFFANELQDYLINLKNNSGLTNIEIVGLLDLIKQIYLESYTKNILEEEVIK
jgi:hypothetical protein